ncbi:SipW-dependent-type signal peptide-containing protein [Haladaptatus sp. NG-WS-4]
MTDENTELSRRKILASMGVIGVGALASGAGTYALLNDPESIAGNTVKAGNLDLKVEWNKSYHGSKEESYTDVYQPLMDDPVLVFELGDVKPCNYGEATIGLHVYHNPAWVFMQANLTGNDENGQNEPEEETEGTDEEGVGELADSIVARLWYDGTDQEEDGGDNIYDPETDVEIASGRCERS